MINDIRGDMESNSERISTLEIDTVDNVHRIVVLEDANIIQSNLLTGLRTDLD